MSTGFAYYEGLTSTKNLLKDLKEKILTAYSSGTNNWTLLKETQDAQLRTTDLYLKGTSSKGTDMYLYLNNDMNKKYINVQSAETMTNATPPVLTNPTAQSKYPFVMNGSSAFRDENTPITYYLSVTNDRLILVLQGDPTVDFVGYLKNLLYFGAMKSLDDAGDTQNICLTCGAEQDVAFSTYGQYSSNSTNSVAVLKTKSGVLWQKHYVAFITQQQSLTLEATGFNASRWTGKYHLSPIYVVHPYDGYRGTLDGLISVDKNNILHLDELLVETDTPDVKDRYKYFDTNAPVSMIGSSPNTSEGLAILKALGA